MKRVVALGFFDGVHLGHGALLSLAAQRAKELSAVSAAISFDVHPDTLVRGVDMPLICSIGGRQSLMKRLYGIEDVILIHFNYETMNMPWEQFLDNMVTEFNAVHFVVGDDFRFGHRGQGNGEKIAAYCTEHGLGWDIVPSVTVDGQRVSSTEIRRLLQEGDMEGANRLLGHPYELQGQVRHGYRLGTKLGTPTVNLQLDRDMLVPRRGVYATKVYLSDGREYPGVTNIGVRPTVSGSDRLTVETFILGFSGDLYDTAIRVEFYSFLRPEQKFAHTDRLQQQILEDAATAKAYFEK